MADKQEANIINAADLLGGIQLRYGASENVIVDNVGEADEGSPLTQVAKTLKESFYQSSWAVGGQCNGSSSTSGAAPEVYTAAVRAALIEYGGSPTATLPERLRAADGLASLLGMSAGAHETLLLRALTANERLVMELQAQATALRHHRCGLTASDFSSKAAYASWRARALRAVRALLLAQQRMPEYNALLEVSLLGAKELALGTKANSGFMCCFAPDDVPLCPYAWAQLVVPGQAQAAGQRTQRTQVLTDTGPNPDWQAALQPLTLVHEESELRFKVAQCADSRGQPKVSQDKVLGVSGVKVAGLQPAVTQKVVLPLYTPPPHSRSLPSHSGSGPSASNNDPNVFYRVVYDSATDALLGGDAGLTQQGKITLQLRYIVERRTRCEVPGEAVFCADLDDLDDSDGETDTTLVSNSQTGRGSSQGGRGSALQGNSLSTMGTIHGALDTVMAGATRATKVTADYLQHITTALAHGLVDNPLAAFAGINGFSSRVRHVQINLVAEPLSLPRTPSSTKLNPSLIIKQLAMALASASRSGRGGASDGLAALPIMPQFPEELRTLLMNPAHRGNWKQPPPTAATAANKRPGLGRTSASAPVARTSVEGQELSATAEIWALLEHDMVRPYLPLGPTIGILLRAALLLCVRAETLLILIVQHMLGDWPIYIGSTLKGRGAASHTSPRDRSWAGTEGGGAQDYLHALRLTWEKCLAWHAAGTLTNDETEGVKGVMGLLLSRVLPALEQHYSVFVGSEGGACFTLLLEMVGWAWTWNPQAPTPYGLLGDYLKDTATQSMKHEFRPSAATLAKDVEAVIREVEEASKCLQRDRDIQLLMPGLKGFAAANAVARYELLYDHLEALALYQPGSSFEAMQRMFDLEVVLLEHHRLLVDEGYADPVPACPVPRHLLPHSGADAALPELLSPLPSRAGPGAAKEFANGGFQRESADLPRKAPQIRRGKRHQAVIVLWDWETAFIEELCRWVRAGVAEMDSQVTRLLANENWVPVSKTTGVANSQVELSRLVEVSMSSWLDAACSGSEARRLHVGVLITASINHIFHQYITGTTATWDNELEARGNVFTGAKPTPAAPAPEHKRTNSPLDGVNASGSSMSYHGASEHLSGLSLVPSAAPFVPGLSVASAPVLARVMSLAVGMGDASQADPFSFASVTATSNLPAPTAPPGPRHGHKRSASQSTAFASTVVAGGVFKDVGILRLTVEGALSEQQGLCLSRQLCVVRASLHKVTQEAREVGVFLLQCLVAPFAVPGVDLPRTGSDLLDAAVKRNQGNGRRGRATADSDSDDSDTGVPVRPQLSSMRGTASANPRTSGSGATDDAGWGRKKQPDAKSTIYASQIVRHKEDESGTEDAAWGKRKLPLNAPANGAAGRAGSVTNSRVDAGGLDRKTGAAAAPSTPASISNFVGAYFQELQRRTGAVITSMVSSYSVTLRSAMVSIMVSSCGIKRGDPVEEGILKGLLRSVYEELTAIGSGLCGDPVLVAEMTGAVWRAATSTLQLLVLNQAGFRPLVEEECELLREMLASLQHMYTEEVPKLVRGDQVAIEPDEVPDPRYPQVLQQRMDATPHPMRQFSTVGAATPVKPTPELLASLDTSSRLFPEDDAARRVRSRDYCAALLQLACAPNSVLQDLFRSQESCMHVAQPDGASKAVYVPLSPQQLPLLDLLRLMRARRKTEPASAAWADAQLKDSGAVITQVLFGLVGSERVVAEFKCVLAGASRSAGRLIITQGTLCFTTMLDADARALSDTTLSVLRAKVVSATAGSEPGSLVLTTTDHDILAFTCFAPASERERLVALLTGHTQQQGYAGASQAGVGGVAASRNSITQKQPSNYNNGTANNHGVKPATAAGGVARSGYSSTAMQRPFSTAAAAGGATATDLKSKKAESDVDPRSQSAYNLAAPAALGTGAGATNPRGARNTTTDRVSATRRAPNRDPWAARAARGAEAAQEELPATATKPAPATTLAPPPVEPVQVPDAGSSSDLPLPPVISSQPPIMSVPCALYGTIMNSQGVLSLYDDRIEFVATDGIMLHRVALTDLTQVTQQAGVLGGTRLVLKIDPDAMLGGVTQLQFAGLSDALITSLKQSIIDLT